MKRFSRFRGDFIIDLFGNEFLEPKAKPFRTKRQINESFRKVISK